MAYKYRGTKFDAGTASVRPASTPGPKSSGFDPAKCGEYRGVKQHYRYGVEMCDACRKAHSDYQKAYRGARPKNLQPCGTRAAYRRHVIAGEKACGPCNEANNAHNRKMWRSRFVRSPFDTSACGTHKGYVRHTRRRLEPCDPCKAANTAYTSNYRAARQERLAA